MAFEITPSLTTDIVIIGGGPAGLAAALAVREMGLDCLIIERTDQLGGQILAVNRRQKAEQVEPEVEIASRLVDRAEESRLRVIFGASIYRVDDSRQLILTNSDNTLVVQFRILLLATGARERVLPFPNWTLPGVITAGAAQRMVFGAGVSPGKRVLVAGSGPLMLTSAASMLKAGIQVVGVIEATPIERLVTGGLAVMLRSPAYFGKLFASMKTLFGSQAQLRWGQVLVSAEGDGKVQGAVSAALRPGDKLDLEHQELWEVDTICVSDGLLPNLHLYRALDGELLYDQNIEAFRPVLKSSLQSSLDWVFVAGETASIGGAEKAAIEGEIAGIEAALALDAGKRDGYQSRLNSLNNKRYHLQVRWERLQRMFLPIHERPMRAGPDTPICRCEEIPLKDLQQAIQEGDGTLRDLKLRTRLGMGLCQGRQCEHLAHRLLAEGWQIPAQEIETLHIRPPLEPVPLSALIGRS